MCIEASGFACSYTTKHFDKHMLEIVAIAMHHGLVTVAVPDFLYLCLVARVVQP